MRLMVLPLLLLTACTAHDARDGAPTTDAVLSVTAVAADTDTEPATTVTLVIQTGDKSWTGTQTGGVAIKTKSGTYVVKPAGISLMGASKTNVADLYGLTLGAKPGATGRGNAYETGRTLTWTAN